MNPLPATRNQSANSLPGFDQSAWEEEHDQHEKNAEDDQMKLH
jgi:hypothetical protein